ncbi:hypothetical protein MMC11_000172 [Xylographa trunciseda]|nr:hypothetical protein [Xylographa trunciseda]
MAGKITIEQIARLMRELEGKEYVGDQPVGSALRELKELLRTTGTSDFAVVCLLLAPTSKSPWTWVTAGLPRDSDSPGYPSNGLPQGGYKPKYPDIPRDFYSSCAIDCMATVFKLLRFGFEDRDCESVDVPAWRASLSSPAKEFFEFVDQDSDQSEETMIKMKMGFYNAACNALHLFDQEKEEDQAHPYL